MWLSCLAINGISILARLFCKSSYINLLYITNKTEHFSYDVGMLYG